MTLITRHTNPSGQTEATHTVEDNLEADRVTQDSQTGKVCKKKRMCINLTEVNIGSRVYFVFYPVKRTRMWNGNASNAIGDFNQCKTCAVESSEASNSEDAKPKTTGHNYILAIDLKQNHRCRDAPPFILCLCETFGFPIYVSVKVGQSHPSRTRAEVFNQPRILLLLGNEIPTNIIY